MDHYTALALRYLRVNVRRTVMTIIGTALIAMLIYAAFDVSESYIMNVRQEAYEDGYELTIYTDSAELASQILSDSLIREGAVGSVQRYVDFDVETMQKVTETVNAVLANVKHPYRLQRTKEYLEQTYSVEIDMNEELASTYFQGTYDVEYLLALIAVVFVTYIIAVIGVGIIKNSVQLTTLEQLRDFGNLRCIGATRSELRGIIGGECLTLEAAGILLGTVFGYMLSLAIGAMLGIEVHFYFIPMLICIIAFGFDMIFTVRDIVKTVSRISPADAVRGHVSYGMSDKIKARGRSIFGLIFGVCGDYAYKNLRRGNRRFVKSVITLSIGLTGVIIVIMLITTMVQYVKDYETASGYYQISMKAWEDEFMSEELMRAYLPTPDQLEDFKSMAGVGGFKYIYESPVYLADEADFVDKHISDDYDNKYGYTEMVEHYYDLYESGKDGDSKIPGVYLWFAKSLASKARIIGLDAADLTRCSEYLIEGTTDISDRGIIIVRGIIADESYALSTGYAVTESVISNISYTEMVNYEIGDEIEIYDSAILRERVQAGVEEALDEHPEYRQYVEDSEITENMARFEFTAEVYDRVRAEMYEEGLYTTCVVEGIITLEPNFGTGISDNLPPFMLTTMDNYKTITGSDSCFGFAAHADFLQSFFWNEEDIVSCQLLDGTSFSEDSKYSTYLGMVAIRNRLVKGVVVFAIIILIILITNVMNIINVSVSNIFLRRLEFAQLRAIGMSKRKLTLTVMLEGVIMALSAVVLSLIMGIGIGYMLNSNVYRYIFAPDFTIPWVGMAVLFIVFTAIMLLSMYIPMKNITGLSDIRGE